MNSAGIWRRWDECPELGKLDFLAHIGELPARQITQDFLEHAGICKDCGFWLIFLLSLNEAYFTTPYVCKKSSLPRQWVRLMLVFEGRVLKRNECLSKEETRSSAPFYPDIPEESNLRDGWERMNDCEFSRRYFEELFEKTAELRDKYLRKLAEGLPIEPMTEFTGSAGITFVEETTFMTEVQGGKPN